jgi:hypothetical protein
MGCWAGSWGPTAHVIWQSFKRTLQEETPIGSGRRQMAIQLNGWTDGIDFKSKELLKFIRMLILI